MCKVFFNTCFQSFEPVPSSGIAGSWGNSVSLLRPPNCFPEQSHQFTVPPTVHKDCNFSTSVTILINVKLFDSGHPGRCEEVYHCGFDVHFPDNSDFV